MGGYIKGRREYVIMFISFPILIQFHIISYIYHIMCTKRALKVLSLPSNPTESWTVIKFTQP